MAGDDGPAVARARRPPTIEDEFLTVAEVAAILRLNQQTIRNWIQDSKLPSLRVGRRVWVLRHDVDQLIADAEAVSRVDHRTRAPRAAEGRDGRPPRSSGAARSPLPPPHPVDNRLYEKSAGNRMVW